ncbi:MAG: DegT/DnrJ/EryC1/StrS family aminotransferase [Gemmatimonadales bacterium]|jgi:dTDP-4-amino-4,6-dideoxygalactose transaminase|nr:DegT/DnrJ/EryC1/StrS family aminotransferase [Gemmatimonadales bacterium]
MAMKVPLLDLVAQHRTIREEVQAAVQSVIDRQQFIMGPEVAELERELAAYQHVPHAIGCASGTDALLLPLRALDLAPGDEVIAPAFTFFATAGAIHNAGGTPVFVDIDPVTFNVTPEAIEAAITPRTRGIVVVHLFGQMAAMERIVPLAARHGLAIIEDGAQSVGARRLIEGNWYRTGELGTVGTLSFFPSKNLGGWGDGGMMLTRDEALAGRLARLRLHGGARQYHHEEVGYNSRLDTLQAAVLLVKLRHLDRWNDARRARAARYDAAFTGHAAVCPPRVDAANEHIYHQYTIRVDRRDELLAHLKARDIGCAVYYPLPLHLQPCFAHLGYRPGRLPVTEQAMTSVLSLPIYPELTDAQQDAVVGAIREFYA